MASHQDEAATTGNNDDDTAPITHTTTTTTKPVDNTTCISSVNNNNTLLLLDGIRTANWSGAVPVRLTLAPTSLGSTSIPPPIHVLVSRQTFLHVALEHAVRRLHEYAPPTMTFFMNRNRGRGGEGSSGGSGSGSGSSNVVVEEPDSTAGLDEYDRDRLREDDEEKQMKNDQTEDDETKENAGAHLSTNTRKTTAEAATSTEKNEPYPICWFEDEESRLPLRWQLFVGFLFDSVVRPSKTTSSIPWRIRLHFQSYPNEKLLQLDDGSSGGGRGGVLTTVERTYFNSLKQALVLQHGHAKVALNMTKQSHRAVWDAIQTSNFDVYRSIGNDIQVSDIFQPPQSPAVAAAATTTTESDQPQKEQQQQVVRSMTIPVRLSIDPTKPLIQRRCTFTMVGSETSAKSSSAASTTTSSSSPSLGSLLCDWAPQYFCRRTMKHDDGSSILIEEEPIRPEETSWRVAGVVPPLTIRVVDLWRTLCHPDQFLYIAVVHLNNKPTAT